MAQNKKTTKKTSKKKSTPIKERKTNIVTKESLEKAAKEKQKELKEIKKARDKLVKDKKAKAAKAKKSIDKSLTPKSKSERDPLGERWSKYINPVTKEIDRELGAKSRLKALKIVRCCMNCSSFKDNWCSNPKMGGKVAPDLLCWKFTHSLPKNRIEALDEVFKRK